MTIPPEDHKHKHLSPWNQFNPLHITRQISLLTMIDICCMTASDFSIYRSNGNIKPPGGHTSTIDTMDDNVFLEYEYHLMKQSTQKLIDDCVGNKCFDVLVSVSNQAFVETKKAELLLAADDQERTPYYYALKTHKVLCDAMQVPVNKKEKENNINEIKIEDGYFFSF